MDATEEIRIKKVHTFLDLAIATVVFAAGVGVYFLLPGWGILFCLIGASHGSARLPSEGTLGHRSR